MSQNIKGERFDEISRILASPMPRRQAFKLILGILAGSILTTLPVAPVEADAAQQCRDQCAAAEANCQATVQQTILQEEQGCAGLALAFAQFDFQLCQQRGDLICEQEVVALANQLAQSCASTQQATACEEIAIILAQGAFNLCAASPACIQFFGPVLVSAASLFAQRCTPLQQASAQLQACTRTFDTCTAMCPAPTTCSPACPADKPNCCTDASPAYCCGKDQACNHGTCKITCPPGRALCNGRCCPAGTTCCNDHCCPGTCCGGTLCVWAGSTCCVSPSGQAAACKSTQNCCPSGLCCDQNRACCGSGANGCCPAGWSCCDPATNRCCPPGQHCAGGSCVTT